MSALLGDLLIGADGIHSKVRTFVLGDASPKQEFIGSVTVSGFTPRSSIKFPTDNFTFPAMIFTPVGLIMAVPVNPDGSKVAFGASEELPERDGRQGWADYEKSGEARQVAKKNYEEVTTEPIRSLIDNMNDGVRLWAPYSIPDLPTWHKGRICLLGDSAHALPPNGQGSAQALEDAGVLARLLASDQAVSMGHDKLFSRYEALRRPRVERVKAISKSGGAIKGKTGPWAWWAKQWAIWGFFTWNRSDPGYPVVCVRHR